jgi:transposase
LPFRSSDRAGLDLAMLIAGETSGRPLDDVLAEFGRSRATYFDKLRVFREKGLAGLLPQPLGPQRPWRRSMDVVSRIVMARVRDPGRSVASIADDLAKRGLRVSVRSVERTLSEFGLTNIREAGWQSEPPAIEPQDEQQERNEEKVELDPGEPLAR